MILKQRQSGAVLLISLIFTLLITVLAVNSMQGSSINILMSVNDQTRVEATEKAQTIIDLIIDGDKDTIFSPNIQVGSSRCSANFGGTGCAFSDLAVSSSALPATEGESIRYRVQRALNATPRLDDTQAGSSTYHVFEVYAEYDARTIRQGYSRIVQGIMKASEDGGGQGGQDSF